MVLLNISSFFRTILIIIIIIYALKFLMRYVFPMMMKNYVDSKVNELNKQRNAVYEKDAEEIKKEQGKVRISKNPSKDGEYVDYEEVKD
ncbi:MAG: DUF4834 family protein [Flavobacteriales bacterium]